MIESGTEVRIEHDEKVVVVEQPKGVSARELKPGYAFSKRLLDIAGSSVLLLLLFPIFLMISVFVAFSSKGPILYRSRRVGVGGTEFWFLKFRSMYTDADVRLEQLLQHNEKDGPIFKMKNDPRVTPVGKFLRKYSLDELPQLINVLKGEMALVGPRPPTPREVAQYDDFAWQRLSIKPGITCYWQVMGRSNTTFQEWMELDHKYIADMSIGTDIVILLKTPGAVLKGEGAY